MEMPLHPSALDIAIRLVLTLIACVLVGLNRETAGHSAGLRTTILVGLAAAIAMIQANILLGVTGRPDDAFSNMDVMRLPLGILTGVGFIGGGAILKRGNLVSGVTTAATIWAVSVIGLCFGGGQIGLGVAGTALIIVTLFLLRWLDIRIPREHHAQLVITSATEVPPLADICELLRGSGFEVQFQRLSRGSDPSHSLATFDLRWRQPEVAPPPLDVLKRIRQMYDVQSFEIIREGTH
jgi:putative Mg2+ transporter-C (MgtC) family protein